MSSKTTYSIEINGLALDRALHHLEVLDSSHAGDVRLTSDSANLYITRINRKREFSEIEIPASGYLPFSVQISWKRLRLLLNGHSETVRITLSLDNGGKGDLRVDGMVLNYQPLTEQLSLPLGAIPLAPPDPMGIRLLKRMQELNSENEASPPQQIEVLAKRYERDPELTKIIKLLRGGKCQICSFSFKTKSGEDYVECHHLEHLAHSGLDISRNILVLCANHHRQLHYGNVELLHHNSENVEISLDGVRYVCGLA